MSWTDDKVSLLREYWGQELSANQIAQRIGGVTRNAVIGKAHRLGLDGRPSPIKTGTQTSTPRARSASVAKRSLTPQVRLKVQPRRKAPPAPPINKATVQRGGDGDASAAASIATAALRYVVRAGGPACKWPIGDPGDEDFHFCGVSAADGRPYCPQHCAIAYVRRDSRTAA